MIHNRLMKGVGANLYGQVVVAVTQLAGVPILLHAWGIQTYGQWLIMFAIPGYLAMSDLGFSISAANDMTGLVAAGRTQEAQSVFQSTTALIAATASFASLLIFGIIYFTPICGGLHLASLSPLAVKFTLSLLCADVLIKLLDGINHAGFRANGEYALHTTIINTTMLLQQLAIWSIAITGCSPLAAAGVYFLIRVTTVPATAFLLTNRHKWLRFGFSDARIQELHRLTKPALANLAMPIAQSLNIQGMVLAVAYQLGPSSVVIFSTTRTITRIVLQLIASLSHAAEPEFASLSGPGVKEHVHQLYTQTMRISLWLAIVASMTLAVVGHWFLNEWTHHKVIFYPVLFYSLLVTVISSSVWNQALALLKAANRHLNAAIWFALSCGAAVAMTSVALRYSDQLAWAGISLCICDFAFSVYVFHVCSSTFQFSAFQAVLEAMNPLPIFKQFRRGFTVAEL